jgi:hypothetical protein
MAGSFAAPKPLSVVAQTRTKTCYVGQAVDLYVGVVAEREAPQFVPPAIPDAALRLVETDVKPLSVSGIGDAVFESLLYRNHYRLIPRRPGALTIAPFTARLEDRHGQSDRIRLTVRNPPAEGRPREFLGGVGRFDVEARAEPASVRRGETLEYRLIVSGPAARGVTGAPDVDRFARLPVGIDIQRLPDIAIDEPPSHTFVFRLRPTRSGEAILPPLPVAAFDPVSSRYDTKVTDGIPIRIHDVPRFDPSALAYEPPESATIWRSRATQLALIVVSGLALALAGATIAIVSARRRTRTTRAARRACREAIRAIQRAATDSDRGRAITNGLIAYLERTLGRPPGALTPSDARAEIARAAGSNALAERGAALVAQCDAAQFDPAGRQAGGLLWEGVGFFETLERGKIESAWVTVVRRSAAQNPF